MLTTISDNREEGFGEGDSNMLLVKFAKSKCTSNQGALIMHTLLKVEIQEDSSGMQLQNQALYCTSLRMSVHSYDRTRLSPSNHLTLHKLNHCIHKDMGTSLRYLHKDERVSRVQNEI